MIAAAFLKLRVRKRVKGYSIEWMIVYKPKRRMSYLRWLQINAVDLQILFEMTCNTINDAMYFNVEEKTFENFCSFVYELSDWICYSNNKLY